MEEVHSEIEDRTRHGLTVNDNVRFLQMPSSGTIDHIRKAKKLVSSLGRLEMVADDARERSRHDRLENSNNREIELTGRGELRLDR